MNEVVEILMRRDGLTKEEAEEIVQETREAIAEGNFDALADYCGLEDDYIFSII